MKQCWSNTELAQCWSLIGDEKQLSDQRVQQGRLGLGILLKFFQLEGRFPHFHKERKHQKVGGNQAVSGSASADLSASFSPVYHCSNFPLSVRSRVRVRVCSMRCAPVFDHFIC